MDSTSPTPRAGRRRIAALGLFVLVSLSIGVLALAKGWLRPSIIASTVAQAGAAGMVAYVLAVALLEIVWVPRAWGLVAGGALYGPWVGGLLSLAADMLGASACYLLARSGGRRWVEQLVAARPRASRIIELLAHRRGGVTVAALRVMPVAHYTLVSYAAGLAGVPVRAFILGNAVGILPGAVLYPTIGAAALSPTSPTFVIAVAVLAIAFVLSAVLARWYWHRHAS